MRLIFSHTSSSSSTKQTSCTRDRKKEANFTRSFSLVVIFLFPPPRTISRPPNWLNLFSHSLTSSLTPHSHPYSKLLRPFFLSLQPPKISHLQHRHLRHLSKPSLHAVSEQFRQIRFKEAAQLNSTIGSSEVAPISLLSVQIALLPIYPSNSAHAAKAHRRLATLFFSTQAPTSSLSNFFTSDLRLSTFLFFLGLHFSGPSLLRLQFVSAEQ